MIQRYVTIAVLLVSVSCGFLIYRGYLHSSPPIVVSQPPRMPTSTISQRPTNAPARTEWYIGKEAIQQLQSVDTPPALMETLFDTQSTYTSDTGDLPHAIPTKTFSSFADFQAAIDNQKIDPAVRAILYDNERWQFTPLNEQQDPVLFARKAATLAHAHGLTLIFAPATDLASVLAPRSANKYDAFLSLDILGRAAPYVDVIEIQAQGAQGTPEYAAFVSQAVAQIRAASSTVVIFAGLSSEPTGRNVASGQLASDYSATQAYVNGYWLNIPARSSYCPSCGIGNPTAARDFLEGVTSSE